MKFRWSWLNVWNVALSVIAIACDPLPAGQHHINPFKGKQVRMVSYGV